MSDQKYEVLRTVYLKIPIDGSVGWLEEEEKAKKPLREYLRFDHGAACIYYSPAYRTWFAVVANDVSVLRASRAKKSVRWVDRKVGGRAEILRTRIDACNTPFNISL